MNRQRQRPMAGPGGLPVTPAIQTAGLCREGTPQKHGNRCRFATSRFEWAGSLGDPERNPTLCPTGLFGSNAGFTSIQQAGYHSAPSSVAGCVHRSRIGARAIRGYGVPGLHPGAGLPHGDRANCLKFWQRGSAGPLARPAMEVTRVWDTNAGLVADARCAARERIP